MIVNPQVFNYRLTIGTLIVAFTILAAYSYTNYNSIKSNEDFLKQEKKLLESQISEIISSYDYLENVNKSLTSELNGAKNKIETTYDSLIELKANMSLIAKYRDELMTLKSQEQSLLKKGDSFFNVNQILIKEKALVYEALEHQISLISDLRKENEKLENNISKGTQISANSFDAQAYKMKRSGEIIEVIKAEKANAIRVTFVLAENALALANKKNLIVQIIGPDNNVVADKGSVKFDDVSLIYSTKIKADYNKHALDVIADIETQEPLHKGKYYISVFENERRLGGTQIDLY